MSRSSEVEKITLRRLIGWHEDFQPNTPLLLQRLPSHFIFLQLFMYQQDDEAHSMVSNSTIFLASKIVTEKVSWVQNIFLTIKNSHGISFWGP